jgi:transposase
MVWERSVARLPGWPRRRRRREPIRAAAPPGEQARPTKPHPQKRLASGYRDFSRILATMTILDNRPWRRFIYRSRVSLSDGQMRDRPAKRPETTI